MKGGNRGDGEWAWRLRPGGLALLVALMVVATAIVSWREIERVESDASALDSAVLAETTLALESVHEVLSTAAAAQALVDPDGEVGQGRFDAFATALLTRSVVSSVAYEPRVPAEERAGFEAALGSSIVDVTAEGDMVTAPERDHYFPVLWYAPVRPDAPTGLDMASEPRRLEAMERAWATGLPAATEPLALAPDGEMGLVVFAPLMPTGGVAAGGSDAVGMVSVAYLGSELASHLEQRLPNGARVEITDNGSRLLRVGGSVDGGPSVLVDMVGREWEVQVRGAGDGSAAGAVAVGVGGLLLATVVAGAGWYMLTQQRRLESARSRVLRLQDATADLARARLPDAVWDTIVHHVRAILGASSAVALVEDERGLTVVAATDEAGRAGVAAEPWTTVDDVAHTAAPGHRAVIVPARSATGGVVVVAGETRSTPVDLALCDTFLLVAGAALRRAEMHLLEHRMADVLRGQLTDPVRTTMPDLDVAVVYRPHEPEAGVGGDWYDIEHTAEDRAVVTIGDVVGHGVGAAGAMGQLRIALRSLVPFLGPAAALERIDELAPVIPGAKMATVLCLQVDLAERTLTYSAAGHPPPLLATGDEVRSLDGGRGMPLGVAVGEPRTQATIVLQPGDRIVGFTDGLVERRDDTLDEVAATLADVVASTRHLTGREVCEEIERVLAPLQVGDDLTVVVVTLHES
ncbi:MAG: SpoIIE family protein phosphatase [Acidimicrobiales bacterium]